MFKVKLFLFLSLLKNSFNPCGQDKKLNSFEKPKEHYSVQKIASLPSFINESSGLVMITDSTFWTLNDEGKPTLYEIDLTGKFRSDLLVPNSSNRDWEEITSDNKGNFYIGDFGNNKNLRKDLKIYKYNSLSKTTDTISFSYQDQSFYPPEKSFKDFDCEAMFHYNDSLYLISKNRGTKQVRFYKIPDQPGTYSLLPFYTTYISSMITGAAINKEQKKIALLSYGKIYFFELNQNRPNIISPCSCMGFARNGQAEGIAFLKDNSILVTNEKGALFWLTPKK